MEALALYRNHWPSLAFLRNAAPAAMRNASIEKTLPDRLSSAGWERYQPGGWAPPGGETSGLSPGPDCTQISMNWVETPRVMSSWSVIF
jgi:hypothetical protein